MLAAATKQLQVKVMLIMMMSVIMMMVLLIDDECDRGNDNKEDE